MTTSPTSPELTITPYEFIIKTWTSEPNKFIINPNHHTMGLNT
ncbi:hypothetical protein [Candidatus Tisiphia endosymbiont of Sialis lutaria]